MDVDEFEIFMIDIIKCWSDKLKENNKSNNKEFAYVAKNVLDELINVFVSYQKINNLGEHVHIDLDSGNV